MPQSPEIKTIVTKDLFTANDCLNLDYLETAWTRELIPRLSAMSVRAFDENPERDLRSMHLNCAAAVTKLVRKSGRQIYLFLADAPWQPKSAMVRYKRLWKRYPKVQEFDSSDLSQEIMLESPAGIRYGGIARVGEEKFALASQIVSEEPHGAFFICSRIESYLDPPMIKAIMDIAFPESTKGPAHMVDLFNVCSHLCGRGDAIGRVSRDWDSRSITIDLIMLPECLDEFI
jgi:hypothetical protein